MDRVVVSIGGSILDYQDLSFLKKLGRALVEAGRMVKLYVVAGGGKVSRSYIRAGRKLGGSERYLDVMGIRATRMNAMLLSAAIGKDANPYPPASYSDAIKERSRILVMGGTRPGRTTDGVAARLAQRVKAKRLVNASDVDGVYTKDPKRYPDAKRINRMEYDDLIAMSIRARGRAGPTVIFDVVGAKIAKEARIPLLVLDGRDLTSLKNAILGKRFKGTVVS
ncbi:MAG: UMP kinase [Thermoplasmata archaeon]